MLTQQFGWAIEPDYLAIFKPSNYSLAPSCPRRSYRNEPDGDDVRWTPAPPIFASDFLPGTRRKHQRSVRIPFISAAFISISSPVSGVACVNMESMLRYEFCLHPLIVLGAFCIICTIFPSARGWDEQAR